MALLDNEDVGLATDAAPAYLLASGIHTSLNGGSKEQGFLDASIDLVSRGIPATLIAAGNELANIPATVGNLFAGPNTYDVVANRTRIADIDSDLAAYYDDHAMGIDTAGFLVSSFVPGMAGTKVLRAGQGVLSTAISTGKFGKLTGDALGLLVPNREKYLVAAMKQIGESGNVFKLGEANLLKAFVAGVGQNALEGAAWTATVNATMNASPILDQRDTSDLLWDIGMGAAAGGVVGGLFSGIGAAWKVKGAASAAEAEVLPWTIKGVGGTPAESLSVSDKILWKLQQLDAIPAQDPTHTLSNRIGREAARTSDTLQREIRALSGELAGGDQDIAALLVRNIEGNTFEKNLANLLESQVASRIPTIPKVELAARKEAKAAIAKGLDITAKDITHRTTFVDIRNGMAVLADEPKMLNLADTAKPEMVKTGLQVGSTTYQQASQADLVGMGHLQAEARYHWAERTPKLDPLKVHIIGENDIPMMQKALRDGATSVNIGKQSFDSMDTLVPFVKERQATIAAALKESGNRSNAEIAKIVNASEDVLFGGMENPALWNARKHISDTLTPILGANPHEIPSFMKIITKTSNLESADGHLLEGMAIVAQKEKLYTEKANLLAASILREELPSSAGMKSKAIGATTGATFVASEGGNYGSQSSFWAYVGQRAHNLIKGRQDSTKEIFTPTLQQLANKTDDAIEFSVLNEQLRNLPQKYMLADDGASLVFGKPPTAAAYATEKEFESAMEAFTKERIENAAAGIPASIPLKSPLVQKLVAEHITANDSRRAGLQLIHTNNGYQDKFAAGTFYPIPRNPKDTPHFAFVIDESVGGRGHSKMIYAKDGETLEHMRNEIMSDPTLRERGLRVLTKVESEEYYKSIGQYEFERTLSDNYINTALARKGKSASFLPLTDPSRIVNDFMEWHLARDASLVRTTIEHKYAQDFATLRQYAAGSLEAAKSKFGYVSPLAYAENTVNNPAANLIKMAMDISKVDEYPLWTPLNKFLDSSFSNLTASIGKAFGNATSPEHLGAINSALKKAGYQDVIVDGALYEAMNGKVARGTLTSIVNKANSILATFALRSDPFNAVNNAIGSSVLLGTEVKSVLRAIGTGNKEAAGELAALAHIKVPGTGDMVLSPTKLIAKRIKDFHADKAGREWFKKHGFISSITDQYDQTLDQLGIAVANGDHTALQKAFVAAKGLGDKAERFTANKLAEEFNRYVAAGVMKDITDVAVKHGVLSEGTALAYINTFVNRTQGNYLASQRPVLFQGPLGQAMGLFQTYQFNLLQQVFRHVGEGSKKDLLLMAGLQGGIYGMNGLPAFNAINTHIIAQAGGNVEHRNLYDAVMSGAGKEAGEWLLYGGLSNGLSLFHPDLKTNIYSRGDINPRHITLVPVDPTTTPIVQATAKFLTNVKEGLGQVAMGADVWGTFLRGIEQNGVSRPLAGMAQMLEAIGRADNKVISTNSQGNLLMVHDLYSLSSLMRIAGAKPLDEAMVNDNMFRVNSYRAADNAKRKQLGEGIKTSILNGDVPSEEQIASFAYSYARTGGKQDEFAAFMASKYTDVSVSKAEQLRKNLSSPFSKSMQGIMGGE